MARDLESPTPVIDLLGRADESTAYAMVNRNWTRELANQLQFRQHASPETLDGEADVLIWSDWERPFEQFVPPPTVAKTPSVAVRPWDFGPYPPSWVAQIKRNFDRLCVHSSWIREKAIEGGVAESRVEVVPLGFEPETFRADGAMHTIADDDWFTLLFVGASVRRKGLDVLLAAFGAEFAPDEGVRLVLKDRPVDLFYGGLDLAPDLQALEEHRRSGALVQLRDHLPAEELAALLRSCDVAVFPYRAEGFALPILEALACGTPVIVPRFGACLEFCSRDASFFTPHRRVKLPVKRSMPYNSLGFSVEVEEVDFCEVSVEGLRAVLRQVADAGRERLTDKRVAAVRAAEPFTWQASARSLRRLVGSLL